MSRAMQPCSRPASAALPPCSPIVPSRTVPIRASSTAQLRCRLGYNAWCGRISPRPGVMFSIDTETGFRDAVLINAAYGLGENVVQGTINPDEYYVFKPTLQQGFRPILQKRLGTKEYKLVYDVSGGKMTRNVPVPPAERARYALADDDILALARWACLIEDHYSAKRGCPTPMDYGMGQRRPDGRAVHCAGPTGDRAGPQSPGCPGALSPAATRLRAGTRAERWGENQPWPGAPDQGYAPPADLPRGRGAGNGEDRP